MTTVRIPEGPAFPWRPIGLALAWLIPPLIVGGVLGWFLWQCFNDKEALEQEIVDLKADHAAQVQVLIDEIAGLRVGHAEEIAQLNDDKAALEQEIAALETELADCQDHNKRVCGSILPTCLRVCEICRHLHARIFQFRTSWKLPVYHGGNWRENSKRHDF